MQLLRRRAAEHQPAGEDHRHRRRDHRLQEPDHRIGDGEAANGGDRQQQDHPRRAAEDAGPLLGAVQRIGGHDRPAGRKRDQEPEDHHHGITRRPLRPMEQRPPVTYDNKKTRRATAGGSHVWRRVSRSVDGGAVEATRVAAPGIAWIAHVNPPPSPRPGDRNPAAGGSVGVGPAPAEAGTNEVPMDKAAVSYEVAVSYEEAVSYEVAVPYEVPVANKAMATTNAGAVESAAADADRASAATTHDSWTTTTTSALCVSFGRKARDHDQSCSE